MLKSNDHKSLLVKAAELIDINCMIAICEENLVENNRDKMTSDDFSKKGFVFLKLTAADAKSMIEDQKNFLTLVLKDGDEVLGYLIAHDVSKSEIEFQKKILQIEELKNHKIFYHRQIAKKSGVKNVGQKLLFTMFDEARFRGYSCIVCKIVHQPFYNQASISFHKKFGFKQISEIKTNDRNAGIYLKVF